jgi:hypothetical protein
MTTALTVPDSQIGNSLTIISGGLVAIGYPGCNPTYVYDAPAPAIRKTPVAAPTGAGKYAFCICLTSFSRPVHGLT